jgi:hypothetical protein
LKICIDSNYSYTQFNVTRFESGFSNLYVNHEYLENKSLLMYEISTFIMHFLHWSRRYVDVVIIKPGVPTVLHFKRICIRNVQFDIFSSFAVVCFEWTLKVFV